MQSANLATPPCEHNIYGLLSQSEHGRKVLLPSEVNVARFVAVVDTAVFGDLWQLKRMILLFDALALDLSAQRLSEADKSVLISARNDIEFLRSEGMLTTYEGAIAEERGAKNPRSRSASDDPALAALIGLRGFSRAINTQRGTVGPAGKLRGISLRKTAQQLRKAQGLDAVAVATNDAAIGVDDVADRTAVIRITLGALPSPSETTPWESVLDFRRDPETIGKHLRLKGWINRIAKGELRSHELEDELEQMLVEYEQYMRYHEIVSTKGVVEALVTTSAEIAEDLVKVKWGKLAKAPFDIARQGMSLFDIERQAPGREVAYILRARNQFQRP